MCGIIRLVLGRRWRHSVPNKYIGLRIFWLGFMVPIGIKISMYLAGYLFDFPVTISTYFGEGTLIYSVVDIQSLICAALIFTMMFYYPLRMIINPRYARTFWLRSVKPVFFHKKSLFIFVWLTLLIALMAILCSPLESPIIAGYLVPIIFILFYVGHQLLKLCAHVIALGGIRTPAIDLQRQLFERRGVGALALLYPVCTHFFRHLFAVYVADLSAKRMDEEGLAGQGVNRSVDRFA